MTAAPELVPVQALETLGSGGIGLVEVLIAVVVLVVGILAVVGLTASVARQQRISTWETDQALAAGRVIESMRMAGYAAAASGTDTVSVGGLTYEVRRVVTPAGADARQLSLRVFDRSGRPSSAVATRFLRPRPLPVAP